jgi:hypothetical protein
MDGPVVIMSLAPLGASQPRPLPTADTTTQVVVAALSQHVLGSPAAAGPVEVVQISAAAILRQMAAVLGAAVGQVAAALAVTPGTTPSSFGPGPALAEEKQGTAPQGDRQTSASTSDLRLGATLPRLQPMTAAVGEAAAVLGSAAAIAAASPAVRSAPAPSSPAQRGGALPPASPELRSQASFSSSTILPADVATLAPARAKSLREPSSSVSDGSRPVLPGERHLTEAARAAGNALRGATEILAAVRERVEETAREPAAWTVEARNLAGTVARAEAQVALASTQFGGLTPPMLRDPAGRHGARQLRSGGHEDSTKMHVPPWAGSTLPSARLLLLVAMFCVAGVALGFLAALDRTPVRVACAVALLLTGATFATRRLRAWSAVASAIRAGLASGPGHERPPT